MQSSETIKTNVDLLMELLVKYKDLPLKEIAKKTGIKQKTLDKNINFLAKKGLLEIKYKFMEPSVILNEEEYIKIVHPEKFTPIESLYFNIQTGINELNFFLESNLDYINDYLHKLKLPVQKGEGAIDRAFQEVEKSFYGKAEFIDPRIRFFMKVRKLRAVLEQSLEFLEKNDFVSLNKTYVNATYIFNTLPSQYVSIRNKVYSILNEVHGVLTQRPLVSKTIEREPKAERKIEMEENISKPRTSILMKIIKPISQAYKFKKKK